MSDLFLLSPEQMAKIEPFFPLSHGVPRVDDRRVISGIIYVLKHGLQWKDAPRDYGPHKTLYNRFRRWTELGVFDRIFSVFISTAHAQEAWRDTVTFTLEPGEYTEIKMVMDEGAQAQYFWTGTGGRVNFDLHAHGGGKSVTYEKGRGATGREGGILAPFAGEHGWFWRNRDKSDVTITLQLKGDYKELVRSN